MGLPYGPRNAHVNASYGPDSNLMHFYCTRYGYEYGKHYDKFKPRTGKHTGTGYLSNFRPGVYYSQRLDELDNPALGRIIAKNYCSITKKDFLPYKSCNGKEPLPRSTCQVGTGFVRQKPITTPTEQEVKGVCIDTRIASAPAHILPKSKPYLHKLKLKDPIEQENDGYGPGFMTTETHEQYKGLPSNQTDISGKTVGPNEETGFTHALNAEPITYQPGQTFKGDMPGWWTGRPTGRSIMKTDFKSYKYPNGSEPLPVISSLSDKDTGFTKGTKALPIYLNRVMSDAYDKIDHLPEPRVTKMRKSDPAEYMNAVHPDNYSSVAMNSFLGKPPSPSEAELLGRSSTGNKELSGFCENNEVYVHVPDDKTRFITHYETRFWNKNPEGKEREGHCRFGVQSLKPDGFTKSTAVHSNGPDVDSTGTLRSLAPYVSRSIKTRDPFYDDHSHDSKKVTFGPTLLHREMTV